MTTYELIRCPPKVVIFLAQKGGDLLNCHVVIIALKIVQNTLKLTYAKTAKIL